MTETDFFRVTRERLGDYSVTINRISTIGGKPYKVAMLINGRMLSGEGETLPDVLSSLLERAGIDRRKPGAVRPAAPITPEDRKWPGA